MTYTLTGRYPLGDLTGRDGEHLRFTPSTTVVGEDNIILPAPVPVTLDSDGAFSVDLVGTDDPAYAPSGWVWTVQELMDGGRPAWSFELTADSDLSDLATVATPSDPSLYVPITRTLTAGDGLTGGGTLAANRTFAVGAGAGISVAADAVSVDVAAITGTTAGTLAAGAHAAQHAAAGADPVTVAESQVTGLTAALAAKADDATTLTAGAGLTGGGTLAADRTFAVGAGTGITVNADNVAVAYGTSAGTAAQGNDSRITGAVQSSLYDANTILAATTDNTPAALAVAASRIVGRKATGDIAAMTAAEALAVLGLTVTHPNTDDVVVKIAGQTVWADSGVRELSAAMLNGWTATNVRIRRTNNVVRMAGSNLNGSAASADGFIAVFAGFTRVGIPRIATYGPGGQVAQFVLGGSTIDTARGVWSSAYAFSIMWFTDDAWPASLPGTLVSAAPA